MTALPPVIRPKPERIMETFLGDMSLGQIALDKAHVIVRWNAGVERMTGLAAADMLGTRKHWRAFLPKQQPVLADWFLSGDFDAAVAYHGSANLRRMEPGGEWVAVCNYLDTSGELRPLLTRVAADPHGDGVIQDLYDLERIANWMQASTSILDGMSVLAEHVPAGVCLFVDSIIVMANKTFCNMFGYESLGELLNNPASSLLVEQERERHAALLKSLNKQNAGARYQWTGLDKNGRKVWFEGRPTPIELGGRPAVLSFVMDVTEYKLREELMERESRELRVERDRLKASVDCRMRLSNIIGRSQKMQDVYESILRAAASDSGTVVYGETGTGKELVARAVHGLSAQSTKPFGPVSCGAIPEELFESEFFGHRKGSFTGAYADKPGLLDKAKGGTLFLDELGEIGLGCQAKLLRALGSREYTPVGGVSPVRADFRIIAATNRNLREMVQKGQFREDLFYRVHIIPIYLPPLRDRKEDIPYLVEHILGKLGASRRLMSKEMALLLEYDWPGNVRELHNVLERFVAFGHLDFLKVHERDRRAMPEIKVYDLPAEGTLREGLAHYERKIISDALEKYGWNRSQVAAALGLPRKTLFRKMKKLEISES